MRVDEPSQWAFSVLVQEREEGRQLVAIPKASDSLRSDIILPFPFSYVCFFRLCTFFCHSKCGGEDVELAPCTVEETEAIVGFHRIVREESLHRVEPPPPQE